MLYQFYIKQNKTIKHAVPSKTFRLETLATGATGAKLYDNIYNIFTVPCEKSKMAFFSFFNNEKHYCIVIYFFTLI